jgi:hypothetical protein
MSLKNTNGGIVLLTNRFVNDVSAFTIFVDGIQTFFSTSNTVGLGGGITTFGAATVDSTLKSLVTQNGITNLGATVSIGPFSGNGVGLTNLGAANIAVGGTLPALNAAALTNLNIAAGDATITITTNAGVLSITANLDGGVATNVTESAAGDGIAIVTNDFVYTISTRLLASTNITLATNAGVISISATGDGDFKADGSVPMTGSLKMGLNDITNANNFYAEGGYFASEVQAPSITLIGGSATLAAEYVTLSGNILVSDTNIISSAGVLLHGVGITNGAITTTAINITPENEGPDSIFKLGVEAGLSANPTNLTDVDPENDGSGTFIGTRAGKNSTGGRSTIFGHGAGEDQYTTDYATIIGFGAAIGGTNAQRSTIVGYRAASTTPNVSESTLVGNHAARYAVHVTNAVFMGSYAGETASNAHHSIFIGRGAGQWSTNSTNSILIGAGVNVTNTPNVVIIGNDDTTNTVLRGAISVDEMSIGTLTVTNRLDPVSLPISWLPYTWPGTTNVLNPTNGLIQRIVLTNPAAITMSHYNVTNTESIRLELVGSNAVTFVGGLSNATALTITGTNYATVWLFDKAAGETNWWGSKLR